MKKAKYNEVPKEYRRNYKKEILNLLGLSASALAVAALLVWLIFG